MMTRHGVQADICNLKAREPSASNEASAVRTDAIPEPLDAIPEPICDWDDEPTVEIPAQTMHEVVYGDTQPVLMRDGVVPGHEPIGPARPTRDMRPLGRGRKNK